MIAGLTIYWLQYRWMGLQRCRTTGGWQGVRGKELNHHHKVTRSQHCKKKGNTIRHNKKHAGNQDHARF